MSMIGNSLAQGLISGANIQDGTVDTPDLKDSAVTAAKIAAAVITPAKLSTGAPTWDTSGNLGLGGSPLAVSTYVSQKITAGAGGAILQLSDGTIDLRAQINVGGGVGYFGTYTSATPLALTVGGTEGMRLTSTGLGIGVSPTYRLHVQSGDASSGATVWNEYVQMSTSGGSNFGNGAGSLWAGWTNNGAKPVAGFSGYLIDGGSTATNYAGGAAIWTKVQGQSSPTRQWLFDHLGNVGGAGVTPPAAGARGFFPGTYGWFGDNSGLSGAGVQLSSNLFHDGTNWVRRNNNYGTIFQGNAGDGAHYWYSATTGTASSTASPAQTAVLDRSGNLTIAGSFYPGFSNSYSVSISGWTANTFYTVVNPGDASQGYYLVFFRWDHGGSGGPYIVAGGLQWNVVNTNGGGTDNVFTPACSSHTGGSTNTISARSISGTASTTGLQFRLDGWSGNGNLTVKLIKLY